MQYIAFEYERRPGDWCVEAQDERGEFHHVFFTGPKAEHDAREYADWKSRLSESEINHSA